ncbi:MAG TPA: DUF1501 domain-containing protein, partial [Bryobacteraceae bacterium]|nr:DUF1501 domain-containing protein [Bryobacteraceae bacterium]
MSHKRLAASRRDFLANAGSGLGALALGSLLTADGVQAAAAPNPLKARQPHHKPTAKAVIWLFMEGGPSHVDLFDPKPELEKLAGQPMPASFGKVLTAMGTGNNSIMPSRRTFKRHG